MIDELRLNTKLIGFDGVIGRRDFCLNIVYLCMISAVFMVPLTMFFATHSQTMADFFALNKLFWQASLFLKLWVIGGAAGIVYISLSNWIRRFNDINGFVNKNANILISALAVIGAFSFTLPFGFMFLISLINTVLFLTLVFKKGKVTANFPYDFRKDFNWGAFFGTWIWGLINKSYKTLWMLILGWTPIGFYYQLLCGLKGNEWAYKNRKWNSDEEFKRSQENQTIGFVVLTVFVLPLLVFVITMALVFSVVFMAVDESKTSPNHESQTMNKLERTMNSYSALYFEGHTITADENKFYVLPKTWNGYSFSEKKDILDMAATTAATERKTTKTKELSRTKIYSSSDEKLLGEFIMDETLFETNKPDFKEIFKASMKAYRFYNGN